jgi:hypothetical protein
MLEVSDVTVSSAEMMSGSFDFASMLSATPACVYDLSSVDSGCYSQYSPGVDSSTVLTQIDYSGSSVTVFMSMTSFGDLCLAFDTDYGIVASEPFSVTVQEPEPEVVEEEEDDDTCKFYLLTVDDITVTSAQMMSGDLDIESVLSGEATCIVDTSTVASGCYQ